MALQQQTIRSVSTLKQCFIYVLLDPRNYQVRYVGKTICSIEQRLRDHILEAKNGTRTYKCDWIRSLLKDGISPITKLIDTVSEKDFEYWEKYYIKLHRDQGHKLTNLTDGGEGVSGYKHTEEDLAKQSKTLKGKMAGEKHPNYGKHPSKKTLLKMSKSHSGENNGMYGKVGGMKNKKLSVSARKLISESREGKTWEEIYGAKVANKMKQDASKRAKERTGKNNGMYNKHHTKKTRKLQSKAKLGKTFPNGYKKKKLNKNVTAT